MVSPKPSVPTESSRNPAYAPELPTDAELVALVRFHREETYLCFEKDEDRWKSGMELARRYQGLLLDEGINPYRVDHAIFFDEVEAFFKDGYCEADIEAHELVPLFDEAWTNILIPYGYTFTSLAFTLARIEPWRPRIEGRFTSDTVRDDTETLAAACAYLQRLNEKSERSDVGPHFYLPQKTAAREMKRQNSYVGLLFRKLIGAGTLRQIKPAVRGENGRAALLRYVGEVPSGPGTELY